MLYDLRDIQIKLTRTIDVNSDYEVGDRGQIKEDWKFKDNMDICGEDSLFHYLDKLSSGTEFYT